MHLIKNKLQICTTQGLEQLCLQTSNFIVSTVKKQNTFAHYIKLKQKIKQL